jgi:hypothetical protein
MNDIDAVLLEAGERWRAVQPAPPSIDAAIFMAHRRRWRPESLTAVAGTAVAAVLVLSVVAVVAGQLGRSPGVAAPPLGGPGGPPAAAPTASPSEAAPTASPSEAAASPAAASQQATSPAASQQAASGCRVTRPTRPFVPPEIYLAEPPSRYASEWFGTADVWTMLDRDGEVWEHLPSGPDGLSQKTFWWSANWSPEAEPEPAITVEGTRLDGPGAFTFGPGTNASADFGTAMLVGIDIPTAGCWELTGTYGERYLSYVVLVRGD